ncbi:pro-corazonin-like [Anopheles darlingi]|uniref:Pro-corazonin n=1 Tax=Anopheles darlingi TaxID=43151 RepID=A0A158N7M1_ANODA|nr:pro-corazonin-like [Anopheles darlingi]
MLHTRTIALVVGLIALVNAQTFQYSRGWTNGKRSSSTEPGANPVFLSRLNQAGLDTLKPNEKALLRRFLHNPCDLRIASLLGNHQSKDLLAGGELFDSAETGGSTFVLPPFLIDSEEANGGSSSANSVNGRSVGEALRFKREATATLDDPRSQIV